MSDPGIDAQRSGLVSSRHAANSALLEYSSVLDTQLNPTHTSSHQRQQVAALDVHRSDVAPVHRLVSDVLLDIFIATTRSEDHYSQLAMARTVSHVSTLWRTLARSGTPQLWTCVAVSSRRDLELYMTHYISLTGDAPLDLFCRSTAVVQLFLETLRPYASRWRSASLIGKAGAVCAGSDLYVTPNLLSLGIISDEGPEEEGLVSRFDAPRLQKLRLTIAKVTSDRQLVLRTSRALVRVSISTMASFPITHIMPLLQQCDATLQQLDISMPLIPLSLETTPTNPLTSACAMHALTALELEYEACALLLSHIEAPNLIELHVYDPPAYFLDVLLDYTTRHSLQHLAHLLLDNLHSDPGLKLLRVLERLDALEELYIAHSAVSIAHSAVSITHSAVSITHSAVSEELMRSLICQNDVLPLVPKLRSCRSSRNCARWTYSTDTVARYHWPG
ncbi:hypothetical protein BD626DRAFT_633653 [Schizophyllum amplum]|uniref:F-box domain-containing protein n=1 Tax=Schizophyllum amplum TaxID=97359 RepID=A0A550C232_9AGAR|nr:hypothetical protein BD626DRAFT_633653 [Auriculariopsis ampla]